MGLFKPPPQPSLPTTPSTPMQPPMFGEQSPAGKKPKAKSQQTSFLGSETVPSASQLGQKTLLGET